MIIYKIDLLLIHADILSARFLDLKKGATLIAIPRTMWSNILNKVLSHSAFTDYVKFLGNENIRVDFIEKKAMFDTLIKEERFGTVRVSSVKLVDGGGNYKNHYLATYQQAIRAYNRELNDTSYSHENIPI